MPVAGRPAVRAVVRAVAALRVVVRVVVQAVAALWAVAPLAGALVRAAHWTPLLAVTPLVPVLAVVFRLSEDGLRSVAVLALLRGSGLVLGAAAAFVLVDAMAGTTGAVPSPRWLRQWLRTGLALGYAGAAWTGTYLLVAVLTADPLPPLPATALPAAGCVLLGLAGAAVVVRRIPELHGAGAGGALLALLFVASRFLPGEWSPWTGLGAPPWTVPGAPAWQPVHTGWVVAGAVSLAVLVMAHRDTR